MIDRVLYGFCVVFLVMAVPFGWVYRWPSILDPIARELAVVIFRSEVFIAAIAIVMLFLCKRKGFYYGLRWFAVMSYALFGFWHLPA